MLLQHLEGLAKTAYSGMSSNPEESSGKIMQEYSGELEADVQIIKKAAASFNQDAAAAVSRYQSEYEMYLTVWLNALSKCNKAVAVAGEDDPEELPVDIQLRKRRADNKFRRFREWRDKALNALQRKFLPKNTPVTELASAKANLEEREHKQRLMKKANSILRSKRDVAARLLELLGAGSEPEIARIQQPGPNEGEITGYSAHELNNNNANIFRLKRRVKELERKIGLMERSSEEMKEVNGVKMIFNYAADRIQLFFVEKPVAERLRQLKANGWHWSPSGGCWQRKITPSSRKSAESIYKGDISEEKKIVLPVAAATGKTGSDAPAPKIDKPKKEKVKSVESRTLAKESKIPVKNPESITRRPEVPVAPAPVVAIKEEVPVTKEEKVSTKASKHVVTKKEKTAAKRELRREIMIKPAVAKEKVEEKPKAIDWAKIAASVQQRNGQKTVAAEEPVEYNRAQETGEDAAAKNGYSYEAYTD